ncbi:acyl-CoA thioesterase [Actinomadura atramentaria]|uniref:acyl-CoA thioesterase n=1 Tax=Actinomadura atramentaria TaxID=1990 RepID=UPI00039C64AB|nr:thioesterase family protein [Actinomadura atramentaria]
MDLDIASAVTGADGEWTAEIDESTQIWGPNGGFLAVLMLRAAGRHMDGGLRPASVDCHFVSSPRPGTVRLTTTTLRRTARTHSVRVVMSQNDRPVVHGLVWGVADGLDGLPERSLASPGGPPPETLPTIQEILGPGHAGRKEKFWDLFEERPVDTREHEEWPEKPWDEALYRAWLRFRPRPRFDDPFVDAGRTVIAIDVYPFMAAIGVLGPDRITHFAPTLSLSVSFHRPQAADSEWLLMHADSPSSAAGLLAGRGRIWGERGELVATGEARMLCRPIG